MKSTVFAVLFLLVAQFTMAAQVSQEIPYYGEKFFQEYAAGTSNDDLKLVINQVLRSAHEKQANSLDEIVDHCSDKNCYGHVSLGYDRARIFMMGVYYLIDQGNGKYAIHDVYCNVDRSSTEFKGDNPPAPRNIPNGAIVNTEHTWPQSRFSSRFDKGMQKSDLHHLFPTDNQMNSARGNNAFGEVAKDSKTLRCRECRTGKPAGGGGNEVFEPPQNHRGNVARALFYFSVRYELAIDAQQEATLRKWAKADPVDDEEMARNEAIMGIQGNRNPFIDYPELVDRISNF